MNIAIIGGGSIGLLFTYYTSIFHDVTLYVRTEKQKEKIEKEGIVFKKGTFTDNKSINVKTLSEWKSGDDLTIVCVKQYQLKSVLEQISFSNNDPFLFIQNGMGHIPLLEQLNCDSIYVATVEHGALRTDENTVVHTGEGKTNVASYRGGDVEFFQRFSKPLDRDFPFLFEQDFYEMLVKKLVVNALINPLTAILKVENGKLLENEYYFYLFKQLFKEIANILQLKNKEQYFQYAMEVCRKTGSNRSSMLKDIEEKRPTEIDGILGYLLKKGEKENVHLPLIETFYYMVKGKEKLG